MDGNDVARFESLKNAVASSPPKVRAALQTWALVEYDLNGEETEDTRARLFRYLDDTVDTTGQSSLTPSPKSSKVMV